MPCRPLMPSQPVHASLLRALMHLREVGGSGRGATGGDADLEDEEVFLRAHYIKNASNISLLRFVSSLHLFSEG